MFIHFPMHIPKLRINPFSQCFWMGYWRISADLKQCALWLLDNGYLAHEVQEILNVSHSSINHWTHNLDEYGHVVLPPLWDHPHTLTTTQTHSLIQIVQNTHDMYLDELQDWLALEHEVIVSQMTLHCIIQDAGLSYKLLRWCAMEQDGEARALWMEEVQLHFVAGQFVWTDESSKDDCTIYCHYGCSALGQVVMINIQFVWGERFNILLALTLDSYITTCIVTFPCLTHRITIRVLKWVYIFLLSLERMIISCHKGDLSLSCCLTIFHAGAKKKVGASEKKKTDASQGFRNTL